jgi:hypothetical protein
MVILIEKETNEMYVYHSRSDLKKIFKVCDNTLLNWSKKKFMEKEGYLIYFQYNNVIAKSKRR